MKGKGLSWLGFIWSVIISLSRSSQDMLHCPSLPEPEEYVDILGGTDSRYDISHGSTLPLITRPWGFNAFAPQTDDDPTWPGWWFHPSDRRFFGIRLTHQPSPWIGDYGQFLLQAYIPHETQKDVTNFFSGYSPLKSTFKPFYFQTSLYSSGNSAGNLKIEFTPSLHGGIMKATFPVYVPVEPDDDNGDRSLLDSEQAQIRRIAIILPLKSDVTEITRSPLDGTIMISGHTTANSGGIAGDKETKTFRHYFVACIYRSHPSRVDSPTSLDGAHVHFGENLAFVDFSPLIFDDSAVYTVKLSTSLISHEQALVNYERELYGQDFETVMKEAKMEWSKVLNRIKVSQPSVHAGTGGKDSAKDCDDIYTLFYTCLYRSSLFPRQLSEETKQGLFVHWSPYKSNDQGRVQEGPLSADSGFWGKPRAPH